MDIKTICKMSGCDWADIDKAINELSGVSICSEKQMNNIKRLIDQQVQVAFNEGVEKGKLGLVT